MAQTNISIRVDEKIKKQFDSFCSKLGISMSSAINLFINTVVREQKIPFTLSINDYNEETRQTIEDIEKGIGLSKPYTDIDEMFNDILKDD